MLKSLRIKATNTSREYKISGLSDQICKRQTFSMRQRTGGVSETQEELTVYEYFIHHCNIPLKCSEDFPCINVGNPKRPAYIPIELCLLVPLQRYTKALSNAQRSSLVEKSRQKPNERMTALKHALNASNYNADPLLRSSGISISRELTRVEGRVLAAPKLRVGNGVDFVPNNGRWNFNYRQLVEPKNLDRWAIANFSARCDMRGLSKNLTRCGQMKGMKIKPPLAMFKERSQFSSSPALVQVEEMLGMMQSRITKEPQFLLCILRERKNSDIYGSWKRKNLSEFGIVTQCIVPDHVNDQYLMNVLLKINAKVVSSRQWPCISRYRAAVRTQSPKLVMIDSLFKKVSDTGDEGVFRELLMDFYESSGQRKSYQIIIFRDGVSESQFNQVLNIELEQIIEACKLKDDWWSPKFMVVVAQKNHHTRFLQAKSPDNVRPGTVIDNGICHPRDNDFYMCARKGMIGTTRPTHYHVLHDELGFSPDDLQGLVHSLSYVYQRSTTAISVAAPIRYAHLAAAQMSQFIKFDEASDHSSSHSRETRRGGVSVPELPELHTVVRSSMFFC